MAHLWIQDASGDWAVLPLDCEAVSLRPDDASRVRKCERCDPTQAPLLLHATGPSGEHSVLISTPWSDVRVNGMPLSLGIRALRDRDEIRLSDGPAQDRIFFSTERLACVEPMPERGGPVHCPRCKQDIAHGSPCVECPQCGVCHHQSDDLPCWTYAERCALCDQPTDLAGGYRWTPEAL